VAEMMVGSDRNFSKAAACLKQQVFFTKRQHLLKLGFKMKLTAGFIAGTIATLAYWTGAEAKLPYIKGW